MPNKTTTEKRSTNCSESSENVANIVFTAVEWLYFCIEFLLFITIQVVRDIFED